MTRTAAADVPPAPGRARRLPAARRRPQLLEVALQLFGRGTYHSTSMDDIAERAGVTKPVLYQHFPSKADLYAELIDAVGAELLAAVTTAAAAETDPQARLGAGFGAYFRFVADRPDAFRLLFGGGARQDGDFAEAVEEVERSIAVTIGDLIEADIDRDHRELLGFGIVGLAEVSSRQWLRRGGADRAAGATLDPAVGELLARRLTAMAWAGLRALPGAGGPPGP